jgi:uncharacterized protein (DUF58 family)
MTFHLPRPAVAWALIAGLIALAGWWKGINLLILFGYFLLALVGVNAWLALRAARRVTATRRPTPVAFAGEAVRHVVEVTNAGPRPATVLVADPAPGQSARWLLAPLPAGESATLRADFTFPRRGRYPVGPLVVESEYPLGLARWTKEAEPPGEVVVLPAVGRVDVEGLRRWVGRAAGGEGRARRPSRRPNPGVGDVRGTRPYRPGDGPRDVHWRTTARRGHLVVREYDRTDPLNLVLVLDPYLPDDSAEAAGRLEWAVGLAASIGWAWAAADEPGDLTLVLPGRPAARGRATPAFVRSAFAPLADLAGTPDVPAVAVRGGAVRTAHLVVGTRPGGPVLAGLRRSGVPAGGADPSAPLGWYLPPRPAGG